MAGFEFCNICENCHSHWLVLQIYTWPSQLISDHHTDIIVIIDKILRINENILITWTLFVILDTCLPSSWEPITHATFPGSLGIGSKPIKC